MKNEHQIIRTFLQNYPKDTVKTYGMSTGEESGLGQWFSTGGTFVIHPHPKIGQFVESFLMVTTQELGLLLHVVDKSQVFLKPHNA